ncbi:uncharacterized protein GGS25DRAFT_474235 [Hypoxylon fragiforme]|uniref:uncharacterized protein n=1 Tax=Hypoxylon fragiforme TaxID=63214 RepID=UPI0020C6407D|nr:uncharacterized protein GGS25DRAFT_474235 [Hypoxylon fragiforme]KAI2612193.1 hypothetical protein GGS25DRAFT_474235 [Hypoxylon fragiforme]
MCHKNVFACVYPDNKRVEQVKYDLCQDSRHGQPCMFTKTFQHPVEYKRAGQLNPTLNLSQFPPTPPLSSHSASASDSEHSSKGRSLYSNSDKSVTSNRRLSRADKSDRTAYIEDPELSRSPPRRYSVSRNVPPSPKEEPAHIREVRQRDRTSEERERSSPSQYHPTTIEVKVFNEPRQNSHRRNGSSKSSTQSQDSDDTEGRRRRRESHVRFEDDEKKKKDILSEITRANEAIASRPAVPAAITAPPPSNTKPVNPKPANTKYRRGSVVVDRSQTALVPLMDQLSLDREKKRREKRAAQEKREREEEEAQKQRLLQRMAPTRRVGQKTLQDDGAYYWD